HERDQRRPDGDAAHEVLGAVDGVDDPRPVAPAGVAELFTYHRVARPGTAQRAADRLLDGPVGVADRGEVRLGLDLEVDGLEPPHRQVVGGVRHDVGETEV